MSVVQRMAMNDECCPKRHNLTECATALVLGIAKIDAYGAVSGLDRICTIVLYILGFLLGNGAVRYYIFS